VLRHTHASTLAMSGVPMAVIAKQLGHADTRMTEKHYAHLAPNYVADTIRAKFPRLRIADVPQVVVTETSIAKVQALDLGSGQAFRAPGAARKQALRPGHDYEPPFNNADAPSSFTDIVRRS
jgi:hypothetical protein